MHEPTNERAVTPNTTPATHPLFHLLLIPIHLQLEAVHLLVALEDVVLHHIHFILNLFSPRVQLAQILTNATRRTLLQLLQVILCLNFLCLCVVELLGVRPLLLDILQVLLHDVDTLARFIDLLVHVRHPALLQHHLSMQLAILTIGKLGQVTQHVIPLIFFIGAECGHIVLLCGSTCPVQATTTDVTLVAGIHR